MDGFKMQQLRRNNNKKISTQIDNIWIRKYIRTFCKPSDAAAEEKCI